jgi:hypothetical protein
MWMSQFKVKLQDMNAAFPCLSSQAMVIYSYREVAKYSISTIYGKSLLGF